MTDARPAGRAARARARLGRAWRAWVALCDRREPATALAAVRVLIGAVMLADLLPLWRLGLVEPLFGAAGFASGHRGWAHAVLGDAPGPALYALATGCAAALTVGAGTRVAGVGYALCAAQLGYLAPDGDRGIHQLLRVVAVILALSQCHARWSVDAWAWRRLGRPLPAEIPAWPRYLLLAQLVWVYYSGGANKAGAEWGPHGGFVALENIVTNPQWGRWEAGWIAPLTPLARAATALTMLFELGAPLYLLAYAAAEAPPAPGARGAWPWLARGLARLRVRAAWIALGLAFHLGIAATMRLGVFPWGMLALYPVLLRPDEIARAAAWLRARRARRA